MIEQFQNIVNGNEIRDKLIQGWKVLYNEEFPFTSYFGINYSGDEIENIKFYFVAFKKVKIESIATFFPFIENVKEIYNDYQESKEFGLSNLGVTFGIKIDKKGKIAYSFYQQHPQHLIPEPSLILLPIKEAPYRNNFYVRESKEDEISIKNYWLISDKENLQFLLDFFKVKYLSPEDLKHMEYAEFRKEQKMVMVLNDFTVLENYVDKTNTPKFIQMKEFFKNKWEILPEFPGYYHSKDSQTMYFFEKKKNDDFFKRSLTIKKLLGTF